MNKPTLDEQIAGARAYEALHVPALFRQWCPLMLDAAGVNRNDRVLDVACGTGVLAREAAVRVGPGGSVAGVDPGPGMLAVARELAPGIEWQASAAESLPYPDASFDAVVSQFGIMFFPDRAQALREMIRVLKPGARLAVAVWDSLENSAAYPEEVELLERMAGKAAGDALRAPFVLGDKARLVALFEASGVESVRIETRNGTARFPNVRTMVEADLRGWLPVMGVMLHEEQIERILAEAEEVLAAYVTPNGSVVFDAPAHIVTGVSGGDGDANRAVVLEFYRMAFSGRRPSEAFSRFATAGFIEHKPDVEAPTRDGAAAFLEALLQDLPTSTWDVVRTVAEGAFVFLHARFIPAPGAPAYAIADVFRLEGGRIAEHWDVVAGPPADSRNPLPRF